MIDEVIIANSDAIKRIDKDIQEMTNRRKVSKGETETIEKDTAPR